VRTPSACVTAAPTITAASTPPVDVHPYPTRRSSDLCVANATPATVLAEGCVVTTNCEAAACVIVNAGLVVVVTAPAVIVADIVRTLSVPVRLLLRGLALNSATLATTTFVNVPVSVPV